MPTPHETVISVAEFWRMLALVLIGFGIALALSWSIDAVVSERAVAGAALISHA